MKHHLRYAALAAAISAFPTLCFAANNKLADGIRQGETQQAQIKTQVQRATDDLTSIIAELNRNGIGGEDVKILSKIRDILGDLTAKDMATVISLLQEARGALDTTKFRGDVTQAVVNQKSIIVRMRQLLLEYKRQQELYELSLRFAQLGDNEHKNLKETKALVRQIGSKQQLDDQQKTSKQWQVGEQDAITQETKSLIAKLAQLAAEADSETAERLKKSLAQAQQGKLEELLQAAGDNLKESKFYAAATAEKNARDRLYELATLVAPVEDSATKLRKAAEKLEKAIAEQKVVLGQTLDLPVKPKPGDEAYVKVEDKQADNVDLTDRLRKQIEIIAPTVTDALKAAQDKMQDTRSSLNGTQRDPALEKEKAALAKLEEGRKLLDEQIAKADAAKPTGDNLEQTKALKEKVAQLRVDQQAVNDQTRTASARTAPDLAKSEAKLGQTARDLQIEAAPQSLPAANEISAATKDMETSQTSLDKAATSEAQAPEKSAVDHLVLAEKLLEQQIEKLEHDKAELANLEAAREKVAKLITDEQRVALNTSKEVGKEEATKDAAKSDAAKPDENKNDATKADATKADASKADPSKSDANKSDVAKADPAKPDAQKQDTVAKPDAPKPDAETAKQISKDQGEVAKKTDEAKQSLPEEGKEASQPLDHAKQEMSGAKDALDKSDPKAAQPKEQEALNDLNKAKDALDKKIDDIQKELGQPNDNANKLDDVAAALAKAQQDITDAQQKMSQSPAQQLAQQQQQIADDIKEKQQENPSNKDVQKAQKAAQDAAEQLAQNNVPKAVENMQKAQDSLQQAEKDQQGQPEGQPQDPKEAGKPGEKGEEQGKKGEPQQAKPGEKGDPDKQPGDAAQQPAQPGQQQGEKQGQAGKQGQQGGNGGKPGQSMKNIAQQQAALQKAAEELANAQQQQQMQQAAQQLGQVANNVTDAAANDKGALPNSAQQALQQAESALNDAAAQAQAQNQPGAQSQAAAAQSAIAQAQAAIAMAQQGMQPGQMADAQNGQPGQQGKPSPAPSPGSPAPGSPSPVPGQADEKTPGQSSGTRQDTQAKAGTGGPRGAVTGASTYLNLPARDRQALKQTQKEKYPEEYGPAIEQYLKNLSDQENQ